MPYQHQARKNGRYIRASHKRGRKANRQHQPDSSPAGIEATLLSDLRQRVREKGYHNLIALRAVCDKANLETFDIKRSNQDSRFGYFQGFYSKPRRANENYRMYWQMPGKGDLDHVTLKTKDHALAASLIASFVLSIGRSGSENPNDPHVLSVVSHYLDNLPRIKRWKSRRSHLKAFVEFMVESYPDALMSNFTKGMQKKLIAKMAPRYDVTSVRNTMVGFGAAVTYACDRDDDNNVFSDYCVDVVMDRNTICDLIDRDPPEVRNWHPNPARMALVLRELGEDENVRRWVFLALFTALRPSHIFELNSRMIRVEDNRRVLDTRRLRATATEQTKRDKHLFSGQASWIKRRPQLPLSDCIYDEISTWGEGAWVGATYDHINGAIKHVATKFDMPLLIPSSFRDFCKSLIAYSRPYIGGDDVPFVQGEIWLGHQVTSKTHEGYGIFHPDYLHDASAAVVHYMKWLDREAGGVLFRQVTAKSASANDESSEVDIRLMPGASDGVNAPAGTVASSDAAAKKSIPTKSYTMILKAEKPGFRKRSQSC